MSSSQLTKELEPLEEISDFVISPIFSLEERSLFGFEIVDGTIFKNSFNQIANFFEKFHSKWKENLDKKRIFFIKVSSTEIISDLNSSIGLNSEIKDKILKLGLLPTETYLQLNCQAIDENLSSIKVAVDFLKEIGFKIIVKGLGRESVNLELLGALRPDIIKIDLKDITSIEKNEFKSILAYQKDFSLSNGSALYFSGITTKEDLFLALEYGAIFLQGEVLSPDLNFLQIASVDISNFFPLIDSYHKFKQKKISKEIQFESELLDRLNEKEIQVRPFGGLVHIDAIGIFKLSNSIYRIYLTDWVGTQVSAYYERSSESSFKENKTFLHKNWSYLPFFYRHVKKTFREPEFWHISDPYWDRGLNQYVIVFSKIVGNEYSIFLDIVLETNHFP